MNETGTIFGVPETMLQTIYARAKEIRTCGAVVVNIACCAGLQSVGETALCAKYFQQDYCTEKSIV